MENACLPYAELAKQLLVSRAPSTCRREDEAGGHHEERVQVNPKLGCDVCCFIGINLKSARITCRPWPKLQALDEVVEV